MCSISRNVRKQLLLFCKRLTIRKFSTNLECSVKSSWESVVGLEIHAQIKANSKLFSGANTLFGAPTNSQVTYFDASIPGTLPVLNKFCVEAGVLTALALNCQLNKISNFDRKHYFYSDLPAGYQITQQFQPLATNGYIDFVVHDSDGKIKPYNCRAKLKQLQLEQDSGRSFHMDSGKTLIDLNRAGIGLMELVFEPDLKNGLEAAMLVKELQLILTTLETCSCIMEEGALRVDANISVHKSGEPWGVRTEVKNINSYRFISQAVDYEIRRQIDVLENEEYVENATYLYDYHKKKTVFMRDKETYQDYRYMPEPNLPPVCLYDDSEVHNIDDTAHAVNIDELRRQMPVLPAAARKHLIEKYNISYESADRIIKEDGLQEIFESIVSDEFDMKYLLIFLLHNVKHQLKLLKIPFKNCPVPNNKLKEIVEMVSQKIISEVTATDILAMFFNGDTRSAAEIVKSYNWYLISSELELEEICRKVIRENKKVVKKYRKSQRKYELTALLLAVNKLANNRASIKVAEAVLNKLIFSSSNKKEEETEHK